MRVLKRNVSIVKIIGLILDIVGGLLIGMTVFLETKKDVLGDSLLELEKDISDSIRLETKLTGAGIGFLVLGFILLLSAEIVVWNV